MSDFADGELAQTNDTVDRHEQENPETVSTEALQQMVDASVEAEVNRRIQGERAWFTNQLRGERVLFFDQIQRERVWYNTCLAEERGSRMALEHQVDTIQGDLTRTTARLDSWQKESTRRRYGKLIDSFAYVIFYGCSDYLAYNVLLRLFMIA